MRALRFQILPETYRMLFWAALAGFLGALATLGFRKGIEGMQWLLTGKSGSLVEIASSLPWYLRALLPPLGGVLAGFFLVLASRFKSDAPPDYMEAIAFAGGRIPARQTLLRSLSSLVTIASGGSIGREGAMVQLASMCASVTGRVLHMNLDRLRLLVACGAAAGITSAYNAPVAGAFFISEIVLGAMVMDSFGPLLVASVVANMTMRGFPGYHPTYAMPSFPSIPDAEMAVFALLGIVAGLAAPQFLRLLDFAKSAFRKTGWPLPARLGLGGLAVGAISAYVPQVWGNGYSVVNSLLHHPWVWTAVLSILVFKVLATAFTAGSGAVGGVFTPTLFVGAASGMLFGEAVQALWPHATAPYAYAIAGMGSFLAAATSAPLMAILMIFDMTWSANVLLPVALSCIVAYFTAQPYRDLSMYAITARRNRDLKTRSALRHTHIRDLIRPTHTVLPQSASLTALMQMFRDHPIKYVYIVDDGGRFMGAVGAANVMAGLLDTQEASAKTARAFLRRDFDRLTPGMPISDALRHFLAFEGERLPVVESETNPVLLGVVYKSSLLDTYYQLHQPLL